VDIEFLEEEYVSESASLFLTFEIPKETKSSTIRVLTDFRKLNLLLKLHPF
jgi:hypothetical protein